MPVYCAPCGMSFAGQDALEQHMRDSSAHKKRLDQWLSQAHESLEGNPTSVKLKQEQPSNAGVKPPEPQQGLNSGGRTRTTIQSKPEQPLNPFASSSSTQITYLAVKSVPEEVKSRWSVIPESEYQQVLSELSTHCHSTESLKKNGYILHPYNPQNYLNSRKCERCNSKEEGTIARTLECTFHPSKRNKWNLKGPYKCCFTEGKGCRTLPTHDFQLPLRAILHKDFAQTPAAFAEAPKFRAVTLDCDMAGIASGAIFLCAADYVTGALLINQFPHLMTRFRKGWRYLVGREQALEKEREKAQRKRAAAVAPRQEEKKKRKSSKEAGGKDGGGAAISSHFYFIDSDDSGGDEDGKFLHWSGIAEDLG